MSEKKPAEERARRSSPAAAQERAIGDLQEGLDQVGDPTFRAGEAGLNDTAMAPREARPSSIGGIQNIAGLSVAQPGGSLGVSEHPFLLSSAAPTGVPPALPAAPHNLTQQNSLGDLTPADLLGITASTSMPDHMSLLPGPQTSFAAASLFGPDASNAALLPLLTAQQQLPLASLRDALHHNQQQAGMNQSERGAAQGHLDHLSALNPQQLLPESLSRQLHHGEAEASFLRGSPNDPVATPPDLDQKPAARQPPVIDLGQDLHQETQPLHPSLIQRLTQSGANVVHPAPSGISDADQKPPALTLPGSPEAQLSQLLMAQSIPPADAAASTIDQATLERLLQLDQHQQALARAAAPTVPPGLDSQQARDLAASLAAASNRRFVSGQHLRQLMAQQPNFPAQLLESQPAVPLEGTAAPSADLVRRLLDQGDLAFHQQPQMPIDGDSVARIAQLLRERNIESQHQERPLLSRLVGEGAADDLTQQLLEGSLVANWRRLPLQSHPSTAAAAASPVGVESALLHAHRERRASQGPLFTNRQQRVTPGLYRSEPHGPSSGPAASSMAISAASAKQQYDVTSSDSKEETKASPSPRSSAGVVGSEVGGSASASAAAPAAAALLDERMEEQQPAATPRAAPRRNDTGKPKRPLSAYNLFFRDERAKMVGVDPNDPGWYRKRKKVSFENLARTIGQRWRSASEETLAYYKSLAEVEARRYNREMKAYMERKEEPKVDE